MAKPATNRTNLRYARWIKDNGYGCAVLSYPKHIVEYIDELLAKGSPVNTVVNEAMQRYGEEIKATNPYGTPLNRTSLTSYKNSFWRNSINMAKIIVREKGALQETVDKVEESVLDLLERVQKLNEKSIVIYEKALNAVEKALDVDNRMSVISEDTSKGLLALKGYQEGLIDSLTKLGLLGTPQYGQPKALPEGSSEGEIIEQPELMVRFRDALDAIEGKGKYELYRPKGNTVIKYSDIVDSGDTGK